MSPVNPHNGSVEGHIRDACNRPAARGARHHHRPKMSYGVLKLQQLYLFNSVTIIFNLIEYDNKYV